MSKTNQANAEHANNPSMKTEQIVDISKSAASHISEQLSKRGKGIGIRVGVKSTGCSGLAYVLEFVDQAAQQDQVVESMGIKLFIDPKSLPYLKGISMDYVKEGLNEGFKFVNPNSKGECGCGESFHA